MAHATYRSETTLSGVGHCGSYVRERIEAAAKTANDGRMHRFLAPALLAPLFALLAACEAPRAGGALDLVLDAPRRCAHCGWIESKEEIRSGAPDPQARATYEYKVRMADGSSRVFREQAPTSWRVRERLVFIGASDAGSVGPDSR